MANSIVEFLIKLRAEQGNVSTVADRTCNSLGRIEQKATSVGTKLREAFSFKNFKSSLMSVPGMELLTNPYTMVAGAVGAIAKIGSQAEMTSKSFAILVGSEERAKTILSQINDYAAKTPFTRLQLEKASQTMMSFGVKTGDVMDTLKRLGDISQGDGNKLNALSLVFGQVTATGHLMGQDLMQFNTIGFNPLRELADMTGKSYQEMQAMMAKGQISAEAVAAAIKHATDEGGKFHGTMSTLSTTLSGRLSTVIGNLQNQAIDLFNKMEPSLLSLLNVFDKVANFIVKVFGNALAFIAGLIPPIIEFIKNWGVGLAILTAGIGAASIAINANNIALAFHSGLVAAATVATNALSVAQKLLNAVMSANPIAKVILLVTVLVAAVVACWKKFAGFRAVVLTVWDTLKGFGNVIKNYVIDRIKTLLSGIGKIGDAIGKLFNGDFKGAANLAAQGFKDVSGISSAQRAAAGARNVVNGVSGSYRRNLAEQQRIQAQRDRQQKRASSKISAPSTKGSNTDYSNLFGSAAGGGGGKNSKGGKGGKSTGQGAAEALATGGTRNTSIHISIGKFMDRIDVTMMDRTDTADLQRTIVECLTRSLAIATSTDR